MIIVKRGLSLLAFATALVLGFFISKLVTQTVANLSLLETREYNALMAGAVGFAMWVLVMFVAAKIVQRTIWKAKK